MEEESDTDFGMSSNLSFPGTNEDGQYYSAAFDTSASFTMNPLSQHPPRTPHASITRRSSALPGSETSHRQSMLSNGTVDEKRRSVFEDTPESDESVAGDDEAEQVAKAKVLPEEIWRDLFASSNGRDKGFKIIQYSLKLILLLNSKIGVLGRLQARLEKTASGLSFARKLMLLFNWLDPLTTVLRMQRPAASASLSSFTSSKTVSKPQPFLHALLHAPPPVLLDLVNCFADDIYVYALIGLFPKKLGDRAARMADWCWFFATLVGLVENAVERSVVTEVEGRMYQDEMGTDDFTHMKAASGSSSKPKVDVKEVKRLSRKDFWLQITRAKLLCDLVFVTYDLWKLQRWKKTVQTLTGFSAALLSTAKLFDKQRTVLAAKM
ncbi:hypothetical protein CYLTODRAFT_387799 [Cylindrobasidium torrendii FP15055 ss-10]|uniref:Uncharacterized protein n=1 Tax=Cylindrobasidium torrendii FP15055 ss-10 TaxID=1314674 RepID=A0A0D7BR85_9AGAR|nr:hypothetical protein CYLTODRAFT_387799 [Cylindrobasidium torrendii FP15055 ss-10]